jgi:hypothetical protein
MAHVVASYDARPTMTTSNPDVGPHRPPAMIATLVGTPRPPISSGLEATARAYDVGPGDKDRYQADIRFDTLTNPMLPVVLGENRAFAHRAVEAFGLHARHPAGVAA